MKHDNNNNLIIILLLIIITLITFNEILDHDFLSTWDDADYVIKNEAIRGFSLHNIKLAFTKTYVSNYAPLHIISYMLDYTVFGLKSGGFLAINLLIHTLNGILFFYLLQRLTWSKMIALVASFIFLCHPVQVESVSWISQRKNLLAMFFFLVSWHAYIYFREETGQAGKYYAFSLMAFTAALLTKAVAVVMAPILVVFDYCYPSIHKNSSWKTHLPFWGGALIIGVATAVIQDPHNAGGRRLSHYGGSPLGTVLTMIPILARYVLIVFWPVGLSAEYDFPTRTSIDLEVMVGFLILCLFITGCFVLYRKNVRLFFWSTVFIIGIAPVSGFIPLVTQMNDRYLYFPLLGASVCLSAGLVKSYEFIKTKHRLVGLCLFLPLLILPLISHERTKVWHDSITLWSDAVGKYPGNADGWASLGQAYAQRGWQDNAIHSFEKALSLTPQHSFALEGLGLLHLLNENYLKSRSYLLQLSVTHPKNINGLILLAKNYLISGYPEKAREVLLQVLNREPANRQAVQLLQISGINPDKDRGLYIVQIMEIN